MKHINILMVDDHPIIIEGYQNVLMATKEEDQTLLIDTANNCDTAQLMINRAAKGTPYDVCFFDISLPPSEDGRYASGEDLPEELWAAFARGISVGDWIIVCMQSG